jgi:thymidylate synthase (FAD)
VRHTWLNFNQRSHRYTKVDRFVIPDGFGESEVDAYLDLVASDLKVYKKMIEKGVKKESARFVIPQGCATTVLVSGPEVAWADFASKRAIPQAQGEIRRLAEILKEHLKRKENRRGEKRCTWWLTT